MAKISVIVPVYGVEKYIKKCISSIVNQTFTDMEILIVDDGTKDNSIKVIKLSNPFIFLILFPIKSNFCKLGPKASKFSMFSI